MHLTYSISCKNCKHLQTSKKIETRLTEHKNAINRYIPDIQTDLLPLPASYTHDNKHKFYRNETRILDQAKTKHARQFKEAWYI